MVGCVLGEAELGAELGRELGARVGEGSDKVEWWDFFTLFVV